MRGIRRRVSQFGRVGSVDGGCLGGSGVDLSGLMGARTDQSSLVRDLVCLVVGNGACEHAPYACVQSPYFSGRARILLSRSLNSFSSNS